MSEKLFVTRFQQTHRGMEIAIGEEDHPVPFATIMIGRVGPGQLSVSIVGARAAVRRVRSSTDPWSFVLILGKALSMRAALAIGASGGIVVAAVGYFFFK